MTASRGLPYGVGVLAHAQQFDETSPRLFAFITAHRRDDVRKHAIGRRFIAVSDNWSASPSGR
ncbi:hypothetical protein H8R18_02690 [Nanchangia anserum]|uniref:hypothetical protein n=1 Tax=Nanchangia anserum TaxID=2692125 RepID=UPI0018842633|nr:hypothetical protein [Nanchangia anserum]QOX82669.1 hypothetical protein H8R18_02690 [Nanchangia anserum]